MIIWGSKGRYLERGRGEFHCPQCDAEQEYKKIRVATYFTLYFIPLFETEHHGTYVECTGCKVQFKPEVLDYKPPTAAERAVAAVRAELESGTPVQMARTKLINAGTDPDVAEKIAAAAAGDDQRSCPSCQLNYIADVAKCSSCGSAL